MTFHWTDELASRTPPFRGDGKPLAPKKVDAKKLLAPVATSLAPLRAPDYRPRPSLVTLSQTGEGSFADEADALVILGGTGQKGQYKGSITVVGESEARKVVDAAVDRWIAKHGSVGALDILALLGAWKPYDLMSSPTQTMRLARDRMRRHLAHATDYAAALARAELLAAEGMPAYRKPDYDGTFETLAYLFPDHKPFFAQAVAELARAKWPSRCLVASVTTIDDYRAIPSVGQGDLTANALVIPRSLRDSGLALLVELATQQSRNETIALALTAYVSPEAATAVATFVDVKSAFKTVAAYFAAHPELTAAAVGPLTEAKEKATRAAAAKLLAGT